MNTRVVGFIRNQDGFSLMEVIVAGAVGTVILLAIISSQSMMFRQNRAMTEKMAAVDLSRSINVTLSSAIAACDAIFAPENLVVANSLSFDGSHLPYSFAVKQFSNIATAGAPASPLSDTLMILPNNTNPAGIVIQITSVDPALASIQINFDQTQLVHPINNLVFPNIPLIVTGPPNQLKVVACAPPQSPAAGTIQCSGIGVPSMRNGMITGVCVNTKTGAICGSKMPVENVWACATPRGWPANWFSGMGIVCSGTICTNVSSMMVCEGNQPAMLTSEAQWNCAQAGPQTP